MNPKTREWQIKQGGAGGYHKRVGIDNLPRFSSTASIASSILEYRAINGRTYHSARHATDYFTPNDEQHQESLDITYAGPPHLSVMCVCSFILDR